jgi:hypothetical protein
MKETIKPVRLESLLASLLSLGTWLASFVIAAGLVLSLFQQRSPFPAGAQVVTAGIGLFMIRMGMFIRFTAWRVLSRSLPLRE